MQKLNILFLTPRFPFPLIGGDRVKAYYLLKHLSSKYNVTLITFFQGETFSSEWENEFKNMGIDLRIITLNPILAGIRSFLKLFGKLPLEILFYTQPSFQKEVDTVLNEKKIDLAFAFFMRTNEYIKDKNIKKILISEDCRTLYMQRSYKGTSNLKQKIVRWWEYNKLKNYEPRVMNSFNFTTLVTKEDAYEMQKLNNNAKVRILTNGTDTEYFKPKSFEIRKDILFSGKLDLWANIIMCKRIVNDIFPLILAKLPNVKLNIVGANPTNEIFSLLSKNVILTSDVPEMLPFLQETRLFLHPHLGGSGIQNKLIEAMSSGCPVITTSTGNQGINATNGIEAFICNENLEIAMQAIEILTNDELAQKLSRNARQHIIENQSWDIVNVQLDRIIEEVIA